MKNAPLRISSPSNKNSKLILLPNCSLYFFFRALSKFSSSATTAVGQPPERMCESMKGSLIKKQVSLPKKQKWIEMVLIPRHPRQISRVLHMHSLITRTIGLLSWMNFLKERN